jgi:hypothetical protein
MTVVAGNIARWARAHQHRSDDTDARKATVRCFGRSTDARKQVRNPNNPLCQAK